MAESTPVPPDDLSGWVSTFLVGGRPPAVADMLSGAEERRTTTTTPDDLGELRERRDEVLAGMVAAIRRVRALVDSAESAGWWPDWRIEAFRDALDGTTPDRPHVRVEPGMRFGQPAVRGVSCDVIAERLYAGESVEAIAEDYDITRGDVLVACWYLAQPKSPRWRRRWRVWAEDAGRYMWAASTVDYDQIPDPPRAKTPGPIMTGDPGPVCTIADGRLTAPPTTTEEHTNRG